MVDHAQLLRQAVALHRAGNVAAAAELYRRAIEEDSNQPEALNLLGLIELQSGRPDEAIALLGRAARANPRSSEFHANLGRAYASAGRGEEALAAFERAARLDDRDAAAWAGVGTALTTLGRLEDSLDAFRRARDAAPRHSGGHYNYALALQRLARLDEAVMSYRRAIELQPAHADAYTNLSAALKDLGRIDDAIAAARRAIDLRPAAAAAHNNLGRALKDADLLHEAAAAHRRAIELQPGLTEAHNNLATVYRLQGRLDESIASYRRAVELRPDYAAAHSNLLLTLNYHDAYSPRQVSDEHLSRAARVAAPRRNPIAPHVNARDPATRLRVGYVSPDLRAHAIAFFVEPLLAAHDRERVEAFCYSDVVAADDVTARLRARAHQWRDTAGLGDEKLADLIRADGIDILVDLAGHSPHNRLRVFAERAAPVQVSYLGYPNTTGLRAMDYRVTDAHLDPSGQTEPFSTERLMRLPRTFAVYRPPPDAPAVVDPPALARGHVTFGSFNNLAKLTPRVIDVWAQVLHAMPRARLLVQTHALRDDQTRRLLAGRFADRGIDQGRLDLRPASPMAAYLAAHADVDVCLDPFPFTGHTVSLHALWMGVPLVTLAGNTHVSRRGVSLLMNLGLPELIAHDEPECVAIAATLAGDLCRLAELRRTMRQRMRASPLVDEIGVTRELEGAYRSMWESYSDGPRTGLP